MPSFHAIAFIRLTKASSLPSIPTASAAAASLADTVIRPSLLGHADDYDVGLLLAALHEALKAQAQS